MCTHPLKQWNDIRLPVPVTSQTKEYAMHINFYHKNTLFFSKCIQYLKTYYMVEPLHLMVINTKQIEIYRLQNNQNHIHMESQTTVCPSK